MIMITTTTTTQGTMKGTFVDCCYLIIYSLSHCATNCLQHETHLPTMQSTGEWHATHLFNLTTQQYSSAVNFDKTWNCINLGVDLLTVTINQWRRRGNGVPGENLLWRATKYATYCHSQLEPVRQHSWQTEEASLQILKPHIAPYIE